MRVGCGHFRRGRRLAGADRPDRFVGDHQLGRRRSGRHAALELGLEHASVLPASRSASVSPMQTIGSSPARHAASALARTMASVSPQSVRRSEWPTMTWLAPASRSISADISPVWAPLALAWQSCPPTSRPLPLTASATASHQGRRRADQHLAVGPAGLLHAVGDALGQGQSVGLQAVHLPVAGNQRTAGAGHDFLVFSTPACLVGCHVACKGGRW